jgi:hypothetical protein
MYYPINLIPKVHLEQTNADSLYAIIIAEKEVCMKRVLICIVMIGSVAIALTGQSPLGSGNSPKDVVDQLWTRAARGELLAPDGWNRASGLFVQHIPAPGNGMVRIISNYWGVGHASVNGDSAEVDVEYSDAGRIDSSLRYSPPPKTRFYKTMLVFHLVFGPTQWTMFKSDGKAITGKEERKGAMEWQIKDPPSLPWTTVNTAIRFVLEMREKTADQVIKRNADQTLAKLLKLQ